MPALEASTREHSCSCLVSTDHIQCDSPRCKAHTQWQHPSIWHNEQGSKYVRNSIDSITKYLERGMDLQQDDSCVRVLVLHNKTSSEGGQAHWRHTHTALCF